MSDINRYRDGGFTLEQISLITGLSINQVRDRTKGHKISKQDFLNLNKSLILNMAAEGSSEKHIHSALREHCVVYLIGGSRVAPNIALGTLKAFIKRELGADRVPASELRNCSVVRGMSKAEACKKLKIGHGTVALMRKNLVMIDTVLRQTAEDFASEFGYVFVKITPDGACQLECFIIAIGFECTRDEAISKLRETIYLNGLAFMEERLSMENLPSDFLEVWSDHRTWVEIIQNDSKYWGNDLTLDVISKIIQKPIVVFRSEKWADSNVGLDTHVYCGDGMRRNTNMGNVKLEEYVQNGKFNVEKFKNSCVCLSRDGNHYDLLLPQENMYVRKSQRPQRKAAQSQAIPIEPIFNWQAN